MASSCIVLHVRIILKSCCGLCRSIYDFGFHLPRTPALNFPKKTNNPNPSPIGNKFGLFLFGPPDTFSLEQFFPLRHPQFFLHTSFKSYFFSYIVSAALYSISKTVPPLADDPAGIPPTPALFQVSFPYQLCRPANSALHSPPSMTRSFRHRQINFLLQGSQPVRPGANQRHTLPESIIIILCANDTQRAQQVVKLCISHSNTSFRPSCYAFRRKKSKTQTQPRGTIRLPGAVVSCRSFLPPAASVRPQHESAPPGWAHPSVRHSPRY